MLIKKILIDFPVNTNAFERNKLIRRRMEQLHFKVIIEAFLIKKEVGQFGNCYEDAEIEKADWIEVHYL